MLAVSEKAKPMIANPVNTVRTRLNTGETHLLKKKKSSKLVGFLLTAVLFTWERLLTLFYETQFRNFGVIQFD